MTYFCDTHCHLYLQDFKQDLDKVIDRAKENDVRKILIPGIDVQTSRQAIQISKGHPGFIYAAAGIHPNYASKIEPDDLIMIESFLKNDEVKAIGEIGLDFYRTWSSKEDQVFVFKEMLNLAQRYNLPVCLHNRDADDEILVILEVWYGGLSKNENSLLQNPGVFHSYNGSKDIAVWAVEHHFKLGISGPLTFKNAIDFREIIQKIGIDHLILETDAPYLSPHPNRGKRNEPANVIHIAEELSKVISINIDQVAVITNNNANAIYNWSDD